MGPPAATYQPRAPAERVLYQVVRDHYETFRAAAAGVCDGSGLPRFVQEEFEGFLRCEFLAGGFARFQCDGLPPPDAVMAAVPSSSGPDGPRGTPIPEPDTPVRRGANIVWAQLMARSFEFDVLACSRCGGRFRLIALIEHPRVVQRILGHLGLPCEVPAARPSRAPPLPFPA